MIYMLCLVQLHFTCLAQEHHANLRSHLESEKAKFGPLYVGRNIRSLGSGRWAEAAQEKLSVIAFAFNL